MAEIDYNNPNSINPGIDYKPNGFLGGFLYGQDRKRYEDQASLADMMQVNKMKEYQANAPLRDMTRSAGFEEQRGKRDTNYNVAKEGLREKQLSNRYNEGTLEARMGQTITDAEDKDHSLKLKKLKDGMQLSTMMMQAMGEAGPAGAAQVVQGLKQRGIDVQNDPVVNYVMSTNDHGEMSRRIQQVQQAYSMADQAHRTKLMESQHHTARSILDANVRSDVADTRVPSHADRIANIRWEAYKKRVKQENPTWSQDEVEAEAVVRMDSGQYGAQKPQDYGSMGDDKAAAKLEEILPYLKPDSDMAKRIKATIDDYKTKAKAANPNRPGGAGKPQAGTKENPIVIK